MEIEGKFESWAIVELMGHKVFAGYVRDIEMFGTSVLRIDVPEVDGRAAFTKFFSPTALYGITPTDEATARHAARTFHVEAFSRYELPALPAPSTVKTVGLDEVDDDDEEEPSGVVDPDEIFLAPSP